MDAEHCVVNGLHAPSSPLTLPTALLEEGPGDVWVSKPRLREEGDFP